MSNLVTATPLIETPAATSRLNTIIHQNETKEISDSPSTTYNLATIRQLHDPISPKPEEVLSTIHREDDQQKRRSSSSASSTASERSSVKPASPLNVTSMNISPGLNRNPNLHRSFDSLPHSQREEPGLKPSNKTASLDFGAKPVQYDDTGSIYITPVEAAHPAIQSHAVVKGWLRKQNRDSFFKRIERYYCVLSNNTLLMHRHDYDRKPQKAINLKGNLSPVPLSITTNPSFRCSGAKVLYYEDLKHGPALELTWSKPSKDPKHYHVNTL